MSRCNDCCCACFQHKHMPQYKALYNVCHMWLQSLHAVTRVQVSCSPCPVTTDAEQPVKGPSSIAAAIDHGLALQHHHGVPVSRGRRTAHHPQTTPCEGSNVQDKDVIHEASSSFRVTTAKDQHQVAAPKDSCMIGPRPGNVSCALRGGPAACA